MPINVETNNEGNIVIRPVTGWTTHFVAGIVGILRIEYIENPQEFEATHKSLQLALTAPQSLELAEVLNKLGKSLLQSPQTGEPHQ